MSDLDDVDFGINPSTGLPDADAKLPPVALPVPPTPLEFECPKCLTPKWWACVVIGGDKPVPYFHQSRIHLSMQAEQKARETNGKA